MDPKVSRPDGWSISTIKNVAEYFVDGDWIETPFIEGSGIRLIQTGNIGIGAFLDKPGSQRFISRRTYSALRCHPVELGDILICRLADPVGRACQVPAYVGPAITAVDCTIFRPNRAVVDPRFALHWFASPQHLQAAADKSGGSTRKRISRRNLGSLSMPLPPLQEQREIAHILDTIANCIDSIERLIVKLEQAKQGLLHDLLTRGISESGEMRDPTRPGTFVDSELGMIPCDWQVVSITATASQSHGSLVIGPFGSDLVAADYRSSGVPVVFVRDVQSDDFSWNSNVYISEQKAADLSAHTVHPGDLVITKMGLPPAIAAVYPKEMPPGVVTADIIRLRPDADAIDASWLSLAINSDSTRHQVAAITGGVTRPKITLRDFRTILVAVPPRSEQAAISDRVRAPAADLAALRRERNKLLLLKRGLTDDLLTGRVRVEAAA
jgi:type I restriction enzyme S subunit